MIRTQIKRHGLRNCAMLTIAPTGTTSEVMDVSGGIEPLFSPVHIRRRWKGEERFEELVLSRDYIDHPKLAQGAYDISAPGLTSTCSGWCRGTSTTP
jgi:ribonucleotide reductase alpha subunit